MLVLFSASVVTKEARTVVQGAGLVLSELVSLQSQVSEELRSLFRRHLLEVFGQATKVAIQGLQRGRTMAAFEDLPVPAAFCAGVLEAAVLADGLFWKLQSHGSAGAQGGKKQEAGLEQRTLLQEERRLRQSSKSKPIGTIPGGHMTG